MLTDYIEAAMRHAEYKHLPEDDIWYGEIPELPGLWASADTWHDIPGELRDALEGWIVLGLQLGQPIPPIDGISLAFESAA